MLKRFAAWFDLSRHDIRTAVPAAIRPIVQNGLVERVFLDALTPPFLFPQHAALDPVPNGIGDTILRTRLGLLAPTTTGLGGNTDPSASTYNAEQYQITIDQYAGSTDTNMLQSAVSVQNKYLADVQRLGTQAGQSLNRIARNKLYAAYGGGLTFVPAGGTTNTSWVVDDATGFDTVLVNGVPTAVSATNPLNVTINGVANTVTGCNLGTNTLTLGTTVAITTGWVVASVNAPSYVRGGSRTSQWTLTTADVATMAMFRTAVSRLRSMAVPTVGGYYVAHIDATTEAQLFADSDFKTALTGRVDSPVFRDMSIGRFQGIDWVRNIEAPAPTKTVSAGSLTIHRAIVLGADSLVAAPFSGMGDLLASTPEGSSLNAEGNISMVPAGDSGLEVALLIREPQDRLQQVVSSTWSWVGDFGVPSDQITSFSSDVARYKRGVVVEHI